MQIDHTEKSAPKLVAKDIADGEIVVAVFAPKSPLMRMTLPATMSDLANGRVPFVDLCDGSLHWINHDTPLIHKPDAKLILHP